MQRLNNLQMNFVLKSDVHQLFFNKSLSRVVEEGFSATADKVGRGAKIDLGRNLGGLEMKENTFDARAIFLLSLEGVSLNCDTTI